MTPDQLAATVQEVFEKGAANVMREAEEAMGNTLIKPDDYPWFPSNDWEAEWCVVSMKGNHVRLVAVASRKMGVGAFSNLITGICKAGLVPVVICPMRQMLELMEIWGWHKKRADDLTVEYFPTRKWRKSRAQKVIAVWDK